MDPIRTGFKISSVLITLLKRCYPAFAALMTMCAMAASEEPELLGSDRPKLRWPPGPTRDYLRNLKRPNYPDLRFEPDSALCCDEGETVDAKFRVGARQWTPSRGSLVCLD
jgi:hypothetical protein